MAWNKEVAVWEKDRDAWVPQRGKRMCAKPKKPTMPKPDDLSNEEGQDPATNMGDEEGSGMENGQEGEEYFDLSIGDGEDD